VAIVTTHSISIPILTSLAASIAIAIAIVISVLISHLSSLVSLAILNDITLFLQNSMLDMTISPSPQKLRASSSILFIRSSSQFSLVQFSSLRYRSHHSFSEGIERRTDFTSTMLPLVNVALQAVMGGGIHLLGLGGAQAAAANLAGQTVIHYIAVASGPIGWTVGGALTAATILYLQTHKESVQHICPALSNLTDLATQYDQALKSFTIDKLNEVRQLKTRYDVEVKEIASQLPNEVATMLKGPRIEVDSKDPEVVEREVLKAEASLNHAELVRSMREALKCT
jgi:hypothetical protein